MKTLTFRTKITSDTLTLENLKNLMGKEVDIIINEVKKKFSTEKRKPVRKWKMSGKADFGGKLDNVNIRDFAYE